MMAAIVELTKLPMICHRKDAGVSVQRLLTASGHDDWEAHCHEPSEHHHVDEEAAGAEGPLDGVGHDLQQERSLHRVPERQTTANQHHHRPVERVEVPAGGASTGVRRGEANKAAHHTAHPTLAAPDIEHADGKEGNNRQQPNNAHVTKVWLDKIKPERAHKRGR